MNLTKLLNDSKEKQEEIDKVRTNGKAILLKIFSHETATSIEEEIYKKNCNLVSMEFCCYKFLEHIN